MKEYIEREAAIRIIDKYGCGNGSVLGYHSGAVDCAGSEIARIPAADVVEVRHGCWERVIPTKSAAKWSTKVSCSQCHGQGYERYNYCPNCGAYMMGERNGKCE